MPSTDFDYLLPNKKTNPVELRGYVWKVVKDPTRNVNDPGLFYGSMFRMIDIRLNRDEKSTWPDGIVFENVTSGNQLTFQNGFLVDLTHSIVIQKKPRIRNRRCPIKKPNEQDETLAEKNPAPFLPNRQPRRFVLVRNEDITGTSGVGEVAEGTVFSTGMAVINWLKEPYSLGIYQTVEDMIQVHGHEGRTQIQFID